MPGLYKILLVESNEDVMSIMQNNIRNFFPDVELASASTPDAAIELLQRNCYDIVVCDAFLMGDNRISFVGEMCERSAFFLIVITGDSDLTAQSFSAHLRGSCIHHVLYKPLQLTAFVQTLQCAIQRVTSGREGKSKGSKELD